MCKHELSDYFMRTRLQNSVKRWAWHVIAAFKIWQNNDTESRMPEGAAH